MPDPTKPRCPTCHEPVRLRKDGAVQQHPTLSGTRLCGGEGRPPEAAPPVEEAAPPDRREWAVLDGLLPEQHSNTSPKAHSKEQPNG